MIQKETITREDGVSLYRTYSDANKYINKVGTNEEYSEAIDIRPDVQYEETDKEIERMEDMELNDYRYE